MHKFCERIIYAAMTSAILSSYCQKLPSEARSRYIEKLQLISGLDPFCPSSLGKQSSILPPVDASDIVSYLVLQTSFVTAKQFKAHKSMEAYNQFVCGWVKDFQAFLVNGKFVVTSRVSLIMITIIIISFLNRRSHQRSAGLPGNPDTTI